MLAHVKWRFDVLLRGECRDEVECLVDHANLLIAHSCQLPFAHTRNVDAVDEYLAGGGGIQPCDDTQQGGLAGPGWTHDGDELTVADGEADALEDLDTFAAQGQAFGDIARFQGIGGAGGGRGALLELCICGHRDVLLCNQASNDLDA